MRTWFIVSLFALASGCGSDLTVPRSCRLSLALASHGDDTYDYSSGDECADFFTENSGRWRGVLFLNNQQGMFGKITNFRIGDTSFDLSSVDLAVPNQQVAFTESQKRPLLPFGGGRVYATILLDRTLVSGPLVPLKLDVLNSLADDE